MTEDTPQPPDLVASAEEDTPVRRRRFIVGEKGEKTVGVDIKTEPHSLEATTMLPAAHRGEVPQSNSREPTAPLDPPTRVLEAAEQLLCRESVEASDNTPDDARLDRVLDLFERLADAVSARRAMRRSLASEFEAQARKYDALADQSNARGDDSGSAQWAARADELRAQTRRIRKECP